MRHWGSALRKSSKTAKIIYPPCGKVAKPLLARIADCACARRAIRAAVQEHGGPYETQIFWTKHFFAQASNFALATRSRCLVHSNFARRSLSRRLPIEQRAAGRDSLNRHRIAKLRGGIRGEKQRAVEAWGRHYDRHPDDKATALNYTQRRSAA
jgi:hypothetical protein